MKPSQTRPARTAARAFLTAAAVMALAGCSGGKFEKVPTRDVNASQKAFAEQWANKILTAWAKGEYPQVGQEATREFRAGHNDPKHQKDTYKYVKGKVGAFKSMKFYEARRSVPPKHTAYRFQGDFEEGEAEIRVVLDMDGKIGGLYFKPWDDEMK